MKTIFDFFIELALPIFTNTSIRTNNFSAFLVRKPNGSKWKAKNEKLLHHRIRFVYMLSSDFVNTVSWFYVICGLCSVNQRHFLTIRCSHFIQYYVVGFSRCVFLYFSFSPVRFLSLDKLKICVRVTFSTLLGTCLNNNKNNTHYCSACALSYSLALLPFLAKICRVERGNK